MTIKIGDNLPEGSFKIWNGDGMEVVTQSDYFANKKVAVFGLPGAFTPTCSAAHLPGYVVKSDELAAKGIDAVACLSVNDAFVMGAWGREQKATGKVRMMADGSAVWTKALGLELDLTARGMGVRSNRYAAYIVDGVVKVLHNEGPGKFEVSDAASMLKAI